MMLAHYVISLGLTAATLGVLALVVYAKGASRPSHQLFALYYLAIAWWSGFEALAITRAEAISALFWWRWNHLGVIFIPVFFVHFVILQLEPERKIRQQPLLVLSYALGAVFAGLDATPWLIERVRQSPPFQFFVLPGPLYAVFFLWWFTLAGYGLVMLFRVCARSSGSKRNQLRYFAWSMLAAYVGGVPNFFPTFELSIPYLMPFGTYAIPLHGVVATYAIVRHHLMDIRLAVTRTGALLATYLTVLGIPFVMSWWGRGVLEARLGSLWWMAPLGLCTVLATAGPFAYAYLRRQAEDALLREQRRYQRALQKAARGMTQVREVKTLTKLITRVISQTVGVTHASLLLRDGAEGGYTLRASRGPQRLSLESRYVLEEAHPLIQWLKAQRRVYTIDDLARCRDVSIRRELAGLGAALVIPGLIEHRLIGVLVLGPKQSGEPYSIDDLHAFAMLANEAAMAVENALSYEELLRANQQLKAATERLLLQERLAAAGQFAAGMAHEIKNPLSAIKTFAELLPERYQDPDFRGRFFRIVQGEINRINTIVQELLDFAKPAPLELAPTHLSSLVEETLQLLSNQCLKQQVKVTRRFDERGVTFEADGKQLKQMILNLLLNSLEAMDNGGQLTVSTSVREARLILRITDTGSGIAADQLGAVWDPFFTTKERGMGLGLAIVKGVVERHGGRLQLSSEPGRGTTVELSFPLSGTMEQ
ncbi:MAG: GAF domain-containing protein [Candidatus Omnitrophica bacterium]|nr:GAF domain-containing protein [Candidatus Omnitrophota bacterium]